MNFNITTHIKRMTEEIDKAVLGEIKEIAKENGLERQIILNERNIVSALEKQIPKKPILDCIFPSGIKWYLCPACNHNGIEKVGNYCHSCGQALDWSDTE